jgi:LacI family transcriptional regulator
MMIKSNFVASRATRRRVAVLTGSSQVWREQVMRGIAGCAHEHAPWQVYTAPEGVEDFVFFSDGYRWDGVLLLRNANGRLTRRIRTLGVPTVSIGSVRVNGLPRVKVDDDRLAELAVRHLHAAGIRHFAYCSFFQRKTDEDRGPAFARHVAALGLQCSFYSDYTRLPAGVAWQSRQRDLALWLSRLEQPVGVFTWNPDVACQVVEACRAASLELPGQIAVVSGDDEPAKCELSSPTISAVAIPVERLGYEAAVLLERLMNGESAPCEPVLIEPCGVLTVRESSGALGKTDSEVHQALRFIREHASEPIGVPEVAESVGTSRRWLERRFRKVLGRSPHEELRQARLDCAKKLLLETDWTLAEVARAAGLTTAPYLNYVFRRETGCTPAEFRRRFRPTDAPLRNHAQKH